MDWRQLPHKADDTECWLWEEISTGFWPQTLKPSIIHTCCQRCASVKDVYSSCKKGSRRNAHCEKSDVPFVMRDEVWYLIHYFILVLPFIFAWAVIGSKYCEIADKAEENYLYLKVINAALFNDRPSRSDWIHMIHFQRVLIMAITMNRTDTKLVPSVKTPALHSGFYHLTLQTQYIAHWFFFVFLHVIITWW